MKTVFTSAELPHVWAHRKAPYGKSPGAMSFNGDEYLSYGTTIARLHGDGVVFINTGRYSITTSGHQSAVRRAIPDTFTTFQGPVESLRTPLAFVRAMLDKAAQAKREGDETAATYPRRKSQIAASYAHANSLVSEAARCNEFFALGENCTMAGVEAMTAAIAEQAAKDAAKRVKREKQQARKAKQNLAKWRAGDLNVSTYNLPSGQTFLRVIGDKVETSKGITLEMDEAKKALHFVMLKRDAGWHRNGDTYPIAGYQLDRVNGDGVVAGCHRIAWKELDRLAALLA